jgi:mono/diheme cytochrome c family protein
MRLSLVVVLAAAILAACGGSSSNGGGTQTASSGEQVFKDNCVNCHTLKAAGASGQVGPNLDNLKPSDALVVHQVTNGGGGMPPFGGKLTDAQIKAVAQYVSTNAGK